MELVAGLVLAFVALCIFPRLTILACVIAVCPMLGAWIAFGWIACLVFKGLVCGAQALADSFPAPKPTPATAHDVLDEDFVDLED